MRFFPLLLCVAWPSHAETIVAAKTIRPYHVITLDDVRMVAATTDGAFSQADNVIGKESKFAIYPGRPIMKSAVGEPAVVERNQLVDVVFSTAGLRIVAEGRALGRGGVGDRIKVMNLASRSVLHGTILENGSIKVTK